MQFAGSSYTAVGAASAQTAVIPANIHSVMLTSTTAAWVNYGVDPTATVGAGSFYLPANTPVYLTVVPGTRFATIQASAGGFISVAYLS
jgi:hypothetical protein